MSWQRSLINLVPNYAKLTLSDKLDIILHGLNLNKTVGLAVAASVQKYIRNTQRFDNH